MDFVFKVTSVKRSLKDTVIKDIVIKDIVLKDTVLKKTQVVVTQIREWIVIFPH